MDKLKQFSKLFKGNIFSFWSKLFPFPLLQSPMFDHPFPVLEGPCMHVVCRVPSTCKVQKMGGKKFLFATPSKHPLQSHVPRNQIERSTRQCHHPWCSHDSHRSGVEVDAPWEAPLSRSDWAQSPQSGAAAQQLNRRRSWGTWTQQHSWVLNP